MKNQNVAANLPYIYLIAIPLMVKTKVCYACYDDASNLVILTVETIIPITPPEASSNWTGCLK